MAIFEKMSWKNYGKDRQQIGAKEGQTVTEKWLLGGAKAQNINDDGTLPNTIQCLHIHD